MKPEAPPAKMTCRCGAEALLGYTDKDKHPVYICLRCGLWTKYIPIK